MRHTFEDRIWQLRGASGLRLALVAAEELVWAHRSQSSDLLSDDEELIDECLSLAHVVVDAHPNERPLATMTETAIRCRELSDKRIRGCETTKRRLRAWLAIEAAREVGMAASSLRDDETIMAPVIDRVCHYLVVAKASAERVRDALEMIEADLRTMQPSG